MSATETMLRWSSVRSCPRKAVYEATGAPGRDRTQQEERILYRGRSLGRDYVVFLATASGKTIWVDSGPDFWVPPNLRAPSREEAGVIAEQRVEWELGVGHCDAFVVETGTVVEVLSSAHASEAMTHSKLLQAVGYAEQFPDAVNVALVILSPSDFTENRVILTKASRQYADLVDEMRSRVAQVQQWASDGTIPARVCAKPSEARGHFCVYAEHCFEGWVAPPLEQIAADETLLEAVLEFAAAKKERAALAQVDRMHERKQKDAQAVIEAAEFPAGTDVQVGPFKVTRTAVRRKPTFEWEKAEGAGLFEPGLYGDFFKPGSTYSTFKAERVDYSGDEFGDEAPWTDADLA